MKWSKTKSTLESFLCEKLKGRIHIHATVYRKFHDSPARVWITRDGKEILSASDVTYSVEYEKLYQQIKGDKTIPYNPDWNIMFQSAERQELLKAGDEAEQILTNQNIFESYHLYEPLMTYSSLSIEEAWNSENVMIKAFSMFDRRVGKRRLKQFTLTQDTHPLIVDFYKIRCDVEGIQKRLESS
ncbi:hypothetical protein SAMN05880501_12324 [Ureibacillus xyleni]|uniref:Uncharacterized protein n=1 Tax=Ureibacillus xyleni TaxID=614648 RepID=A0A285TY62_9BACL|nr:nonribosomal peptide synthetase [Ureibacillus xyleni]SOC27565.1 hypothetical protein SAMN05880501_12324 [Ureibacillus xyleni]